MTEENNKELYALLLKANREQTVDIKNEIRVNISELTKQLEVTNKRVELLEKKCLTFERQSRKNNIILFGLESQNTDNLVEYTINKLNQLFGVNILIGDINNIYKIGKKSNPPVVIQFTSFLKKAQLFKDPEKLRALKDTNISIANDLCKQDREDLKILRKHLKAARAEGCGARIRGNRLEIDNTLYTVSDLEDSETETEESGGERDTRGEQGGTGGDGGGGDDVQSLNGQRIGKGGKYSKIVGDKRKRSEDKTPSPQTYKGTRNSNKKKKTLVYYNGDDSEHGKAGTVGL